MYILKPQVKKKSFVQRLSLFKTTNPSIVKGNVREQMLWVIPALLLLFIFVFMAGASIFKNAFNANADTPTKGDFEFTFDNFKNLFKDDEFARSIKTSFYYALIVVPTSLFLALFIANALTGIKNKRLFKFFQTSLFMPYVANFMAVSLAFNNIFGASIYNRANSFLSWFNKDFQSINFREKGGFWILVVFGIWQALPFKVLILTTALFRIKNRYTRAASIDGMAKWKQFWKITIPLLMPTIFFLTTMNLITSFKVFPIGLFPKYSDAQTYNVTTVIHFIFNFARGQYSKRAISAPASIILMLLILAMTIAQKLINSFVSNYKLRRKVFMPFKNAYRKIKKLGANYG
ncbi:MAG: sugar ABC transporter permease [Mycoplasma sp.]|nr:sugar ABC transporter permease [Mycoplasma sp.]